MQIVINPSLSFPLSVLIDSRVALALGGWTSLSESVQVVSDWSAAFCFLDAGAKYCDMSVTVFVPSVVVFFCRNGGEILGYCGVHCASVCGLFWVCRLQSMSGHDRKNLGKYVCLKPVKNHRKPVIFL